MIDELNAQLNVRATVNAINLNGLKTFPRISLEMTNVRVNESTKHYDQYVLQAKKVIVVFDALKLLAGNNEIEKIHLQGGAVRLFTDKKGTTNYELFKPDSSSTDDALNIDLKKVLLQNFQCVYVNEIDNQSFNFKSENLSFSGKFSDTKFALSTKGDGLFDHLSIDDVDYIKGKKILVDLALDINQEINAYHIERGHIGMGNLLVDVAGDIMMIDKNPDVDIKITGNNIDIQSVLSVLPNHVSYPLRDYKSSGDINLSGSIVGMITDNALPAINLEFEFNDVAVKSKKHEINCQKINLAGSLNSKNDALALNVNLTELNLKASSVSGTISIPDLLNPKPTASLKGLLDLSDVSGLVTDESSFLKGKVLFNVEGAIPQVQPVSSSMYELTPISGDIETRNVTYVNSRDTLLSAVTAKARIAINHLSSVEIKGDFWKNNVDFKGTINKWQSYAFSDDRLSVVGDLRSSFINLDFTSDTTSEYDSTSIVSLDFNIDTDLQLDVQKFDWGNVHATALSGHLLWDKTGMKYRNFAFNAWNGKNELDADLVQYSDRFEVHSTSISENISLPQLFDEFKNFEQTEFTADILKGNLTTTIKLDMFFDRQFNLIEDKLVCLADFEINDGRLTNYQTMESLSSFVELEDLRDIRFEKLANVIEISDRTISIPTMSIKNNAINLEIGGTHDFDNYMNYRMKIRVTELLASKSGWVKRKKERQLEDNKDGGLSAYILMVGTPDDLKIKYDRKAVKDKIKKEVKKERKEFFQELKREIKREKTTTKDTKKVEWLE